MVWCLTHAAGDAGEDLQPPEPVGVWRFEEGQGVLALNAVPGDRPGIFQTGPMGPEPIALQHVRYVDGKLGTAALFDGQKAFGEGAYLPAGASLELWVQTDRPHQPGPILDIGGLGHGGDEHNVVSGNVCEGNGQCGVWVGEGANNIVSGNRCGDDQHTPTQGIVEDDRCSHNVVSGNLASTPGPSVVSKGQGTSAQGNVTAPHVERRPPLP